MLGSTALGELALGQGVSTANEVVAGVGAFTLTGQATLRQFVMPAEAGAFAIAGQPTLRQLAVPAAVGAFTVSGNAAGLKHGYRLEVTPDVAAFGSHFLFSALGEYALGGAVTGETQATTFVLRGNNADMARAAHLDPAAGSFALTGVDVTLTLQGYPSNIRIFPRVGRGMRLVPTSSSDGVTIRTSVGRGLRARAFGG